MTRKFGQVLIEAKSDYLKKKGKQQGDLSYKEKNNMRMAINNRKKVKFYGNILREIMFGDMMDFHKKLREFGSHNTGATK